MRRNVMQRTKRTAAQVERDTKDMKDKCRRRTGHRDRQGENVSLSSDLLREELMEQK